MAVEIPLREKYRVGFTGRHKAAASGNAGPNRHRGETDKNRKAAAQRATQENMKVLVLVDGRRRSWRPYTPEAAGLDLPG